MVTFTVRKTRQHFLKVLHRRRGLTLLNVGKGARDHGHHLEKNAQLCARAVKEQSKKKEDNDFQRQLKPNSELRCAPHGERNVTRITQFSKKGISTSQKKNPENPSHTVVDGLRRVNRVRDKRQCTGNNQQKL